MARSALQSDQIASSSSSIDCHDARAQRRSERCAYIRRWNRYPARAHAIVARCGTRWFGRLAAPTSTPLSRSLLGDRLQVGETGLEVPADHLVDVEEHVHDL